MVRDVTITELFLPTGEEVSSLVEMRTCVVSSIVGELLK